MFRFRELSLFNWDYWPPVRIPLDREVVLLTGPNGSGKTSVLDAVRQLLNAPRLSSRRRLQHYLRRPEAPALVRAVVSNADVGFGQPFRRERLTTPEVTLACMLVPGSSGTPDKRFAVLPGRASVEEIRARLLQPRGDYIPPERYARILEQAGVTRSLMRVLALEQGKTNTLFDLTPRELLQYVLDMMGDRAVLERYRDARRRYEETEREVARQTHELQRAQVELARVKREVTRLDDWERADAKVAELERRLPAAELQQWLRQRSDAAQKLPGLRTRLKNGETERIRLERALTEATSQVASAAVTLDAARQAQLEATRTLEETAQADGELRGKVSLLEAEAEEMAAIPERDLEELVRAEGATALAHYQAQAALERAETDLREASERLRRLEEGRPAHPPAVDRVLAALASRGIAATLLAAAMEVDADRSAAAEAALGDARYALSVSPEHEQEVLALAQAHGFPGPIWVGEVLAEPEVAAGLHLGAGAPAWLKDWAVAVRLEPGGTWHDGRGTWVPRAVEPVLGESAREVALATARLRTDRAAREVEEGRASVHHAVGLHEHAVKALDEERRRRDILGRVARLPQLRTMQQEAAERLRVARAAQEETTELAVTASLRLEKERAEAEGIERSLADLTKRMEGEQAALLEAEQETVRCDEEIRALSVRITPDLRERAERMELDSPETVEGDLRRARRALEDLGDKPDATIREEERHLTANVEEAERHVTARGREASAARDELSACRQRYLEVVSGALQDYRRRAVEIARAAQVAVEMDLPPLSDDDRVLDEAQLLVRFGFDSKEPLPLGDSSFSGGQQVIAGLVLLMAMVEGGGRGFFMLDEPFAHLSIDRIDDVGRFLRASGAQFIITAPTTLDRAQLDPASLVVMLRKKRAPEPHAPLPVVAEA
jgi:DNA repair exonuclease SbcCD ATPase subunit